MTQHVLSATGVAVGGRPRAMLPPTDVELHTGEVRAVVGEPGHGHTALALILAGRLRPDAGSVALDRSVLDRTRQAAVALVDVPGVSEPDELVPFGTVLGEELAMAGQPARRSAVRAWARDIAPGRRTEDIPAARRTELLLRAAALRSGVHFLVLTLPDRWGVTPAEWGPVADELARHGYGVLVTVGETSRHLLEVPHGPWRRGVTSFRIAFTELCRITAGRLPRLAVLAMVVIPTLYAGLYLYANHDPYGGLSRVPVALVVEDTGATLDGKEVDYGRQVADQLIESGDFDWHEVGRDEATAGVEDGTYDFALTVPPGFSTAITSPARFDPEQAKLVMTTNDANSYLAGTIADTVTTKVRDAISSQVTEQASTTFLQSLGEIRTDLVDAADGAHQLADGLGDARRGARQLTNGAGRLDDGLGTLERRTASLPTQTRQLADGAAQVAAGDAEVARVGREAVRVTAVANDLYRQGRRDLAALTREQGLSPQQRQEILAVYDRVNRPLQDATGQVRTASGKLDQLASGADQVATGADRLADATPQLTAGIAQAHDGAGDLAAGADKLRGGIAKLDRGAQKLATGLDQGVERLPDLSDKTVANTASTLADPVGVKSDEQASAGSYGAGLAPFFLSLGAWIGGYVLFLLVRPLSNRAIAANQSPLRVALGGWYPPALLGLVQMAVVLLVVTFGVGIEPAHVVPTLLFMMLISVTFIAIVHALNAWLGPAGQFLGLALMVVQLVTAGGTFPWQTIPEPLHGVHHVLPMTYAVDGLRQLMYGGLSSLAWHDVLILVLWLVGALALTSVAAGRRRRWTVARIKPELSL